MDGSNFSRTTEAYIASIKLDCTFQSTALLECNAFEMPAGTYDIDVVDRNSGRAIFSTSSSIQFDLVLSSIFPSQGSLHGGVKLRIDGAGFGYPDDVVVTVGGELCPMLYESDNYCVSHDTVVMKHTQLCEKLPVLKYDSLTCIVPKGAEGVADVMVSLHGKSASLSGAFHYLASITPIVESIYPNSGAPGTEVVITGRNFDQVVGEIPDGWYIDNYGFQKFYSRLEAFIGPIPCSISVTSYHHQKLFSN